MSGDASCPLVSVIMPSFNHDRFIASAIASVLSQTMRHLELIIVDDGSADRSPDIVAGISDRRVQYELLGKNRGACEAMNIALRKAKGHFVAVCNSDDEWHPDKLDRQLRSMEAQGRSAAVFSDVVWVDEAGAPLDGSRAPPFESVFRQANRSRWTWMRTLLESGNKLCHPSILIRREILDKVGEYDNRLRQLPDLDMWIRVLGHCDIFVASAKLLRFRLHHTNTSAAKPDVSRRSINEHRLILRKFLSEISASTFAKVFGFKAISIDDEIDLKIEKALYLLDYQGIYFGMFRELGLDLLYDLTSSAVALKRLREKYGFDIFAFQREMAVHSPWVEEKQPAVQHIAAQDETVAQRLERFRSKDLAKSIIARNRVKMLRKLRKMFFKRG
jgi:glycosyltransferase involved in cell wall biosynthesis